MKNLSYKRRRTDEYLADNNLNLPVTESWESWAFDEKVCLYVCAQVVFVSVKCYSVEPIQRLYNAIVENSKLCPSLKIKSKSPKELQAKIIGMDFVDTIDVVETQ